jgi:hypothetical protein
MQNMCTLETWENPRKCPKTPNIPTLMETWTTKLMMMMLQVYKGVWGQAQESNIT